MAAELVFAGIDPGHYGGLAVWRGEVGSKGVWTIDPLPVIEYRKGRFDLDLRAFDQLVKSKIYPIPTRPELKTQPPDFKDGLAFELAVEEPPYIPVNGGFAIRSLFKCYGEIRGVLTAHELLGLCPGPKIWKAAVLPGKSKDKETTIAHVLTVYPDIQLPKHPKYPKQYHDGLADAICLADYARREYFAKNGASP